MLNEKWNLENIPPKGHKDVAEFANNLFEIARNEKDRLGKNADFLSNYSLYKGKTNSTPVNLYFSNVERTVANITAREPVGEVVDLDGYEDDAESILSVKLLKWWKETNQQTKTRATARAMEIYGITTEKPYWDKVNDQPNILLTDPFAFFPAPGLYEDISEEAPYVCFAYLEFIDKIESEFKVTDIVANDAYEMLGTVREDYKQTKAKERTGNYEDALIPRTHKNDASDKKIERALVIEVWIRDRKTKNRTEEKIDEETGELMKFTHKDPVYPDSIRKITIAEKKGTEKYIALDDSANPNINPELDVKLASETHPWGRFPCYHANSYKDLISIWGFSAAEQVGDLITSLNNIMTRLIAYVQGVMSPPLIIQQNCGITQAMIENNIEKAGRMILMPTIPNARIEFMQIPNLPTTFFQVLDLITGYFDRVYTIEDADRGQAPSGIVAASAIMALQERNAVLMQAKTSAIDYIAEQRSRWCLGLYQNFGTQMESVNVADEPKPFRGVDYAGRKFSYVIEAGSSMPKTNAQVREDIVELAKLGLVDQQAVLETLGIPGWKDILERTGENQLEQALQVLVQAGLDEDQAAQLGQYLMQPGQNKEKENGGT